MISSPRSLRAVLKDLPTKTIHGPWSRAIGLHLLKGAPPDSPPNTPPQPLWPRGAAVHGARFTPKGGFDCLYLAADPVTALHEVVSVFTPPGKQVVPLRTSPWVIITVEGVLAGIVDLTDEAILHRLRTNTMELTGDWAYTQSKMGRSPTQDLAEAAYECDILGFQYKSARNIGGGDSLVVFTDHLAAKSPSYLQVFDEYQNLSQRLPKKI